MKPQLCLLLALATCQWFAASSSCAQGSLVPPGAPAVTMRTLDQIDAKLERRTPISSATTISTAGSYYLADNLALTSGSGINIAADNVTLDLNGFTISSSAATPGGTAILINGVRRHIRIKNGFVRGTATFSAGSFAGGGFSDGVVANNPSCASIRVSDVSVSGIFGDGINLNTNVTASVCVERCTVSVCSAKGIRAGTVRDCEVETSGGDAIAADLVVNSSGETVSTVAAAVGLSGLSVVQNSIGRSISGGGLQGQQVSNSLGTSTSGIGLNVTNGLNCQGVSTSGTTGISVAFGGSVTFCRGRRDGGVAISAANANAIGCEVLGTGTVTAQGKFLGTP